MLRQGLVMERVRLDADLIRARCETFPGFIKEAWPILEPATPLRWAWHMDAIADHLQAISNGTLNPRLIVNVSPGSSKSMLVSVLWQAWEWGPLGKPGHKFLSTSYEQGNVTRDTRKTRNLILSEWYQALWPTVLVRQGETSFENKDTGTREGVAFASLTAKRGDRLTIDDPHSLDGAESETERSKAVQRFIEGGQNRLNDQQRSAIVIVMQRLHERDLTGELLVRELGYEHLMIPMEYEPERRCFTAIGWKDPRSFDGELMDPVRMPRKSSTCCARTTTTCGPASTSSARPRAKAACSRSTRSDGRPRAGRRARVRGWDIAGSTRKKSPYTVGAKLAWDGALSTSRTSPALRAEIADGRAS
jgi:hypothetical protein